MRIAINSFVLLGVLFSFVTTSNSQSYNFSTIAGQTGQSQITDGTNSTVRFELPRCLVINLASNFFISDASVIRKMTATGTNWIVNTLAGTPHVAGGTDGTNNGALFNHPSGLAVDSATNIYVADWGNSTIRKITALGTNWVVTTLAGMAGASGSADGTNSSARFNNPFGLILDNSGNLIVADSENNTIRKVSPQGTNWIVATIAGSHAGSGSADGTNLLAQFNTPRDVVMDPLGILYVTDFANYTVRKITPAGTNWIVTTIAGLAGQNAIVDGPNATARFSGPDGITLDDAGNLYVTDRPDNVIRKLTPIGTNWVVTTIGGLAGISGSTNGTGTNALFNYPDNIKVDGSGRLYIADEDNNIIRQGVVAVPSTFTFTTASVNNGMFVFGATDRVPFAAFHLLTSTNLQIPVLQWQSIATNWCDANGSFMFTNNFDASVNQRFYILQSP
jgi:secreted PhoX family phosphatase